MAVVRAAAVVEIKLVGKSLLRIILGTDVFFLVRAIGSRSLACVVNPAHQVVVVRLFAHAGQVCSEGSTLNLIAFSNGVAGETSSRLEQFFSVSGVPRLVLRQF